METSTIYAYRASTANVHAWVMSMTYYSNIYNNIYYHIYNLMFYALNANGLLYILNKSAENGLLLYLYFSEKCNAFVRYSV